MDVYMYVFAACNISSTVLCPNYQSENLKGFPTCATPRFENGISDFLGKEKTIKFDVVHSIVEYTSRILS